MKLKYAAMHKTCIIYGHRTFSESLDQSLVDQKMKLRMSKSHSTLSIYFFM